MASVIPLHIPLPPPVQNNTFPLNKSFTNMESDAGGGGVITDDGGEETMSLRFIPLPRRLFKGTPNRSGTASAIIRYPVKR